jgi:septal ring factor EnvC (AmiA/AmiB activator)
LWGSADKYKEIKNSEAEMKSLTRRSILAIALLAVAFSFCTGLLEAATKHDIFETSERIKELNQKISAAYEELRVLNEEGGEHAQEQAQLIMAEIKEMKAELSVLEQSLASMKSGGPKLRSGKGDPRDRRR